MTWALVAVVVMLLVERAYTNRRTEAERQRLINAVVARNAGEFVGLEAAAKAKPRERKERDPLPEQVGA